MCVCVREREREREMFVFVLYARVCRSPLTHKVSEITSSVQTRMHSTLHLPYIGFDLSPLMNSACEISPSPFASSASKISYTSSSGK